MKRFLELEAIKEVLVEMTANDELPMDMTQLDIHSVEDKAQEKLKDDEQYKKACMLDKLSKMLSDEDVEKAFNDLQEQEDKGNGDSSADMVVGMWQPFEDRYTVSELLEEIS